MSETCGGLGFVTSWTEQDGRDKGEKRQEMTELIRRIERTDTVTAGGREWGAGRRGAGSGVIIAAKLRVHVAPQHWRGVTVCDFPAQCFARFHRPCDVNTMLMSIQRLAGVDRHNEEIQVPLLAVLPSRGAMQDFNFAFSVIIVMGCFYLAP